MIFNLFRSLAYPPTEEQLKIIAWFFNNLWILRFFSLILLLLALFFWYRTIMNLTGRVIGIISCFIVILTPTFYILWLTSPIDCFKIFLYILMIFLFFSNRKMINWQFIGFTTLFIIAFSFLVSSERSSFVHKLGLSDAKIEVQKRFAAEDSLTDPIYIPLTLKRIVYNKYFFAYKEIINETIPFFDMESIFFQEIHPMEQKSIVIFVWPEIFLLIGGIYLQLKSKNKKLNEFILLMLLFSFINFLFSSFIVFRKFELILFPLSLIMALSVFEIYKTKNLFGKFFGITIIFLSLYGTMSNYFDLNKRPDFWLDNRPYFYDFIFKSIKLRDIDSFEHIYVTGLVGNSQKYCQYYLGDDCTNKFVFDSFDLENIKPNKNTIYGGFVGEFVGSDFKNNIKDDWKTLIEHKGFSKLEILRLRDTIAYKYGNEVIIGEVR